MASTIHYVNRPQRIKDQAVNIAAQVMRSASIIESASGLTRADSLRIAEHLLFRD